MKKIVFFLLILISFPSYSQYKNDFYSSKEISPPETTILLDGIKGEVNDRISRGLNEGQKVELILVNSEGLRRNSMVLIVDGEYESVPLNRFDRISFTPESLEEFWLIQALKNEVYHNILTQGFQYGLRRELDEEAIDYINYIDDNDWFFYDAFIENYLYTLINRVFPFTLDDGRPGILNVRVQKKLAPQAFVLPNGTMVLSTGLLSLINSEEELIAVLAHEISHFVLDHVIININKAEERQRRAEFWAGLATGIAAGIDVYAASQNQYYHPGGLTMATAAVSHSVASEITQRLGLEFSREQEYLADETAKEFLEFMDIDAGALSSVLGKIRDYHILTGNQFALAGGGTHPTIDSRIDRIGSPTAKLSDTNYDKRISVINTFNAIHHFNDRHLEASKRLVNRNIVANVETEDDLVLKAMIEMFMHDSQESNNYALGLLQSADRLDVSPNINIPKQKALVYIRLDEIENAQSSLREYQNILDDQIEKLENVNSPNRWAAISDYVNRESEWTSKMIHKLNSF